MRGVSVLLLLLFNLSVSSQISNKVDIVRGTEYEGKRSRIQSLLGSTDEGIVVCRYDKKTPYIELIGEKGNVLRSVSLAELKYNKLNKLLIGGFVLKKRLFIRFSVEDNGNKKTITIIDEYDSNQLAFIRNISTESASTDVAKKVAWYGIGLARTMSERSENGFDISNSENFAMQYSSDFERNKNTNEKVSFKVFDMNMEEKWSKEFEIPYTNDQFQIASVIVDDNGNVHLLGTESFEGTKEKANFRYHVLSFLEEGTRVKDNVLELEANFITDASIGIAGDGYLLAAGFYGNVSGSSIDGSFSTKIDIDQQKVIFASKKEFDKEFIQDGMTEREKKKSDKKEKI